jgi:hypothetical protein
MCNEYEILERFSSHSKASRGSQRPAGWGVSSMHPAAYDGLEFGHVRLDRLREDGFIRALAAVASGSYAAASTYATAAPGSIVIG